MRPDWFDYRTHCHVCGRSQLGKSKWCESCMRDHVDRGHGFCLIDWHGKSYYAMLNYLAYQRPSQPIVLLDLSGGEFIRLFNPFALPPNTDVSAHASRLTDVILKAWGERDSNEMPTYKRITKMLLSFTADTGEPLHHAARLLELPKKELREWAISLISDPHVKQQWKEFQYIRLYRDWKHEVQSTLNRLDPLIGSKTLRLFTGLKDVSTCVEDWITQGAIVLVNIKPSRSLSDESAKVFAGLVLSEFLHAAITHAETERPYYLYLDECQNYLTTDAGRMLDESLKAGLRITFIHHHMAQDVFLKNPDLKYSVEMNAKLKVVFGGLPVDEAKRYAEELFIHEVNQRKEKERLYRLENHMIETTYRATTSSERGSSTTTGTRYEPYQELVTAGVIEWSREEKISLLAEKLMRLRERHYYLQLPGGEAFEHEVEYVADYLPESPYVLEYEKALHSGSIPKHEAERSIEEEERRFLKRAEEYEYTGTRRPKKRPASLHPQE